MSDHKASNQPGPGSESERSLFGEILDWMLAPLLFVWPLSIAFTHYFAPTTLPITPTIRRCVSMSAAIARQVKPVNGKPLLSLPASARAMLRADEIDSVYFHVISGDGSCWPVIRISRLWRCRRTIQPWPGEVYMRDSDFKGQDLRLATPISPSHK
ncbi:MAG: sensor histidine kinase N-terminal domain-containing protein [Betaproteobacteria bacterium]|nr:sensor histidine kinase N-terminal domain-containing protein [Betaproteobacteria bacterium]